MQKKLKIFISGPISNDPNYKENFNKAETELKKLGFAVMNPAILPPDFDWQDYMDITIPMQNICDISYFLPNWEKSKGAKQEHFNAEYRLQPVFYSIKDIKNALKNNTILDWGFL